MPRAFPDLLMTSLPLTTRVEFVVELARRLHEYGTAAPRLEAAIILVAQRLGLSCDPLSTPTSIITWLGGLKRQICPVRSI